MRTKEKARGTVSLLCGVLLLAGVPTPVAASELPDDARPDRAAGPVVTKREVVDKSSQSGYIRYSDRLTYCQAVTAGQTCSISRSFSVTRTIGVDLGITRSAVAAALSISSATSLSVSVTCNSPTLAAGQRYEAFPIGTKYSYRIKKSGTMLTTTYSSYLTAFNPNGGIACRVA